MGQAINYYDNRRVYTDAMQAMTNAGVQVGGTTLLSQSFLRLEVLASITVTSYRWGVLVNDTPNGQQTRACELRLNLQDAFYVAQIQVLLGLAATAAATNFPLYTWNNPAIFTTANAASGLYNFYNGYLSLTVNNRVITPAWDILRHFNSNETQFTAATNSPLEQFNGGLDGSFPSEPNWVLIGSKNNVLTATLPAAITALQAATVTPLVIIMRGVLAQNVTVVS